MPTQDQISEHFTLSELVRSQTALRLGIDNTPTDDIVDNLKRLASVALEPVRQLLGVPLHVDSGYRSPALNDAVGGARTSAHMRGLAADIIPIGVTLQEAFDRIRASSIAYDQVIIECNAWIHVGLADAGTSPRRQALTATGGPGHWSYERVMA